MRKEVEQVLLNNTNLFSWNAPEMPSIDPNFICHKHAFSLSYKFHIRENCMLVENEVGVNAWHLRCVPRKQVGVV